MRTRYGVPYWLDRYPKARQPSYPRHRGPQPAGHGVHDRATTGAAHAVCGSDRGPRVESDACALWRQAPLPVTETVSRSTMFLPIYPAMTEADQAYVVAHLKDILVHGG